MGEEKEGFGTGFSGYRQLKAYRESYQLALEIHRLSLEFPKIEQFGGVGDQVRRSSKSVWANIVEGLGKPTTLKDQLRFLSTALGSAEETIFWLGFARDLGYGPFELYSSFEVRLVEICRMIAGLIRVRKEKLKEQKYAVA